MDEKKFSFGKFKGMRMVEVLNCDDIGNGNSGIKYLWGMAKITNHEFIKIEIEECFKMFAGDYILRFGKYTGMKIKDIYRENRAYIENYLLKNNNEEIAGIAKSFISFSEKGKASGYNNIQEDYFKRNRVLIDEINTKGPDEIERVLKTLGHDIRHKNTEHCPWDCDKGRNGFQHGYFKKGDDGTYLVGCIKCGKHENLINYVSQKNGLKFADSIIWIANILGINTGCIDTSFINLDMVKEKLQKKTDEMVIEKRMQQEINLDGYGFNIGIYPPYFKQRGFTPQDGSEMEVYFAGRDCTNAFRNRICFLIRDEENRLVGVIGRNKIEKGEHYDYWINRLKLSNLNRDDAIAEANRQGNSYKKYYFTQGFNAGSILYNFNKVAKNNTTEIFVVEGPFDVMKMVLKHGFVNTVAMFGHSLSTGQLYQLYASYYEIRSKVRINLFVDNDEVGKRFFEENVRKLQELGFKNVYKMILVGAKDAAEATSEQVYVAYENAELQSIRYSEKKVIVKEIRLENLL